MAGWFMKPYEQCQMNNMSAALCLLNSFTPTCTTGSGLSPRVTSHTSHRLVPAARS